MLTKKDRIFLKKMIWSGFGFLILLCLFGIYGCNISGDLDSGIGWTLMAYTFVASGLAFSLSAEGF